jgi:uncharacterized protein (TIGR03382 family)
MSDKVTREGVNNFQGRYVILHPWTGALACAAPKRGVWGGPNKSQQIATPVAATNLAFAPRGQVQLASLLAKDVPSANLMTSKGQTPPIAIEHKGCDCNTTGDASAFATAGFVALVLLRRRRR